MLRYVRCGFSSSAFGSTAGSQPLERLHVGVASASGVRSPSSASLPRSGRRVDTGPPGCLERVPRPVHDRRRRRLTPSRRRAPPGRNAPPSPWRGARLNQQLFKCDMRCCISAALWHVTFFLMGEQDSGAPLPPLDLTCRLCGAVVVACATYGGAFAERARVHCRREGGRGPRAARVRTATDALRSTLTLHRRRAPSPTRRSRTLYLKPLRWTTYHSPRHEMSDVTSRLASCRRPRSGAACRTRGSSRACSTPRSARPSVRARRDLER